MGEKTGLVVKSNRMTEASYRLTLVEQQIILYAIVKARDTQKGLSDADFVTIKALEFAAMFGTNETMVYGQLKSAVDTLFKRYVVIPDTHPETGKPRIINTRWVSSVAYIADAGMVQLRFAPDCIPFITRLEKEFTAYRLEKIGKLSSVHAVRMYELLVQYMSLGKREFEIVALKAMMGVSEEYKRLDHFKERVIDSSVQQINAHTDITTRYTQRKTGRNVTHLNFKIDAKEVAPVPVKQPSLTRAYVEKHARVGESWEAARERLRAERKK
jgi:plasmid replication initiation protein